MARNARIIVFVFAWTLAVTAWAQQQADPLAIWVVDPLIHVLDDAQPTATAPAAIEIDAARGEFENGQVALRAAALVPGVSLQATPLTGPGGARITAVTVHPLARVHLPTNTGATPLDDLVVKAPANIPDALTSISSFDLHPGYSQAVWIKVWVPRDVPAGQYTGGLIVRAGDVVRQVPIRLRVYDVTVPKKCHLDVLHWIDWSWIPPEIRKDPQRQQAYWRRMMEDMVEHRQNVITIAVFSVISGSIHPRPPVRVIEENGKYRLDTTDFDRMVEMAFEAGFEKLVPSHLGRRAGGWNGAQVVGGEIAIYNPDGTQKQRGREIDCYDPRFRELFSQILPLFYRHLEDKGWRDRVLFQQLADEPLPNCLAAYNHAAGIMREAVPGLRIIDACLARGFSGGGYIAPMNLWWTDREFYQQAQANGELIWQYTCRWPRGRYPNFFPEFPLIRSRMVAWFNWRYGLPGFLNWNYNQAQANLGPSLHQPGLARDPDALDFCAYVAGAPQSERPIPSIRWEALRDGREDFELLRIVALNDPARSRGLVMRAMPDPIRFVRDVGAFRALRGELLAAAVEAAGKVPAAEIEGDRIVWDYVAEKEDIPLPPAQRQDYWTLARRFEFSGEQLPGGWRITGGDWQVRDGWLVAAAARDPRTGKPVEGGRGIVCEIPFDGDVRLEYDCQTDAATPNSLSALIHCGPDGRSIGGYLFEFGGDENAFSKINVQESELIIRESPRIQRGKVHRVVVQRDRDVLSMLVDGQPVLGARDIWPLRGAENRNVGFMLGCDGRIGNVSVYVRRP